MKLLFIVFLLVMTGCTSVASSTAALVVALHSKKIERDTRRYKWIDRCFIDNKPIAYDIASQILSSGYVKDEYQVILNPEMQEKDSYPPYYVAYAFLNIADRIGDSRASGYISVLKAQLEPELAKEIDEFIEYKYLQSHLTKCFSVPKEFKVRVKDRDLVKTK